MFQPGRAPSLVRCSTTAWLEPALSMLINRFLRHLIGMALIAASMIAIWSAAVLEPALPARGMIASNSLVLSHHAVSG